MALRARARLTRGRGAGARRLPGACANAAPRGGRGLPPARRRPSLQFRKCAESAVRAARTRGAEPSAARRAWVARTGSLHVARHVAERSAPGALEPTAAVAEAVSSLTIVDAFIVAGESPPPPPPALRRRFICSFPDCSANYNKAWKLEAHLYKHTGEVTRPRARPGAGTGAAAAPAPTAPQAMSLQDVRSLGTRDRRSEPIVP